jgi:hypothetical protein
MPRAKRSIESTVTIDGLPLIWHLHREQQWSEDDGWRGIAIHVKVAEGTRRELHMEYPPIEMQKSGYTRIDPPRPGIVTAKVEAHVREAMTAGWNPDSRGKPFVFRVSELPH